MHKLLILIVLFLTFFAKADNIGIDFSIGPNSIPSYGLDFTKNSGLLYTNPGIMFNKEMISPQVSFGLQVADINAGLVAEAVIQNKIVNGLGGVELGITDNFTETFYVKENNQLLRDNNANGILSLTFSTGVNF